MAGPSTTCVARTTLHLVEYVDHLFQARRGCVDHIVGQNDREGLVADQVARHQHGVSQAKRLLLAHIGDVRHARDRRVSSSKSFLPRDSRLLSNS